MENKSVKKSVWVRPETVKTLSAVNKEAGMNWSGSVNDLARGYRAFVNDNMPELSANELLAFQIAYNGYIPHPEIEQEARSLGWNISESWQHDEQVRDLFNEDEIKALLERIQGWSLSQCLSVIYKAREFWTSGPVAE